MPWFRIAWPAVPGSSGRSHQQHRPCGTEACHQRAECSFPLLPVHFRLTGFSSVFYLFFFFQLGYACFTVLYWFLPYSKENQLYVYIHPVPLKPARHSSPPQASRSPRSTGLSSLCYPASSH